MKLLLIASSCLFLSSIHADNWYRGNTHTHTVICGHADSPPELVTAWYHDRGYNFLILSEHNHFIDPDKVKMPENKRQDFLLIPGIEVTGSRYIHTTAMNVTEVVPWQFSSNEKSEIIQNHVDGVLERGGQAIVNHPNFRAALTAEDLLPVKKLHMFELYNGHPHVHNDGQKERDNTEELWDKMLTAGMLMYGVSSDDAHHFQTIAPDKSNPGRGWVMVQSPALEADAITEAMLRGDFYASNGVFLKTCARGKRDYQIEVDAGRTTQELQKLTKLRGKKVENGTPGYRIDFIGENGRVLHSANKLKAHYSFDTSSAYVRPRVTYTKQHPDGIHFEEYYAWGQPAFLDGRNVQ